MFLGVIYAFEYSNFKFSNFIIFINNLPKYNNFPKYTMYFKKHGSVNNLLLVNNSKFEVFDINVYFQYVTYLITKIFCLEKNVFYWIFLKFKNDLVKNKLIFKLSFLLLNKK